MKCFSSMRLVISLVRRSFSIGGFFFFFLFSFDVKAQNEINIQHAESLEGMETPEGSLKRLTGNVVLQQNNVTLLCDNADLYDATNKLIANGHVKIIQDTVTISSDHLVYDGNTRKAVLTGNVKLTDTKIVLKTSQLDYDLNTKIGYYHTGATVTNDSSVLTSNRGFYHANNGDIDFKDNVKITDPKYFLTADSLRFNVDSKTSYFLAPTNIKTDSGNIYCEGGYYDTKNDLALFTKHARVNNPPQILTADSILYNMKNKNGEGFGHIRWADTTEKIILLGNYAKYNENTKSIYATKHPVLINVIENDSMFMTADKLFSEVDSATDYRSFHAYHHVKIFKSDMSAVCDSLAFSYEDSTFRFFHNPVLWVDKNQLKADTINMLMSKNKIDKIDLRHSSIIVSEADTSKFNQIQGKNMVGSFRDGKMNKLDVTGNGESIYYAEADSTNMLGVNKAICSNMIIYIDSNKVDRIIFLTKPEATLYPVSQAPADEIKLKNFVWLFALKPKTKEDILN